jgi:mRNA-degrading endonuclease HigB of HigAB toxin-antitoxin module
VGQLPGRRDGLSGRESNRADRIIFNVKGNQFRVVAAVDYARRAIFIKFVGTHAEYDRIDAATVNDY